MVEAENSLPVLPSGRACCTHRGPEDDFFCLRFGVWYPSLDCAYRTRWRTAPGCANCDQGRFNLKRHAASLSRLRPHRLPADGAR
jgi:hypothetical protein